jgi:signal peptidase I
MEVNMAGYDSYSFAPDENIVLDKIVKYIVDVIIVICMGLFTVTFFGEDEKVVGNSMSPTLQNDQKIFINN